MKLLSSLLLLHLVFFMGVESGMQRIDVKARFTCRGQPSQGVKAEIWDEDGASSPSSFPKSCSWRRVPSN